MKGRYKPNSQRPLCFPPQCVYPLCRLRLTSGSDGHFCHLYIKFQFQVIFWVNRERLLAGAYTKTFLLVLLLIQIECQFTIFYNNTLYHFNWTCVYVSFLSKLTSSLSWIIHNLIIQNIWYKSEQALAE